jgi:predicted metal-binding protein
MLYRTTTTIAEIPTLEYIEGFRDADRFIAFCKECKQYLTCWACPPYNFDTLEYISNYKKVFIIGTKVVPEINVTTSNDKEYGRNLLANVRVQLDEKLLNLEKEYPDSKVFFAGTCFHCPNGECPRSLGLPCVQPDKIRYSLESFGFDIGKTCSDLLHLELKWSKQGELPEYLVLVSGLFTNEDIVASEVESRVTSEE